MWGPDAKKFKPSRWLEEDEGTTHGARTLQGYRHIMTFGDGARMCPGRLFALTEFKVRSCTSRASVPDLFDQVWIRFRLYCSFLCETLCLRWQMALRCRSQRVWGLCPDRGWLGVLRLEMCLSACAAMKFDSYTIQLAPQLTQVICITVYGSRSCTAYSALIHDVVLLYASQSRYLLGSEICHSHPGTAGSRAPRKRLP